ncbi:MAG: response regulator [Anaerolineae bacterium]|nr:response regulator [Anaerolineae bacterium]
MDPRRRPSIRRLVTAYCVLAALLPVLALLLLTLSDWLSYGPGQAPHLASPAACLTWLLRERWPWLLAPILCAAIVLLFGLRLRRQIDHALRRLQEDLSSLIERQPSVPLPRPELAELEAISQPVKQLAASRATLAGDLERLTQQLVDVQTHAILGQLAVGIAHDLNNPLATILGLASIIQTSDPDPVTRRDIEVIRRQAELSGQIVRSLLSFARRQKDTREWVSINELVRQTLELVAYEARVNRIRCETDLAPDLPLTWGEASPLQQVLFNLITNAIQAMAAQGRGNLRIETCWSPPGPAGIPGRITVRVIDDGPGIAEDVLPRLFEPYFTTRASSGGLGLGLSIASEIVRRHNGQIWAENNPSGGACFSFQLPVARQPENGSGDIPRERYHRVLLADGDPQRQTQIAQILRRHGCSLTLAGDGLQARSRLDAGQFDLVVCQLDLGRLDGRELYAWARIHRPELAARFVFVVDGDTTTEAEAFLHTIRAWVLAPPFHEEALLAALNQALYPPSTGERSHPAR